MSSKVHIKDVAILKNGKKRVKEESGIYELFGANGKIGYTDDFLLERESIVIGRVGANCGSVHFSNKPVWISDNTIGVVPKKNVDSYYLYYYLKSLRLNERASGSAQPLINQSIINSIDLNLIDINKQRKVGSFLKSLDNKIEINEQVIINLEKVSESIFKHWFIDFEFPNEQGQPYKSSGGEMVESELGEIPRHWKSGYIRDICELNNDKVNLDKTENSFNYIGLEHMPQRSIALSNWESSEKVTGNKNLFKEGDILFGKLRPYFKKVGIASVDGVCSTDILIFNSKHAFEKSYLLLNLVQDRFIEYTTITATGTRMPRSGWKQISSYKIAIPDKNTLLAFEEIVLPMIKKIQYITHENLKLQQLRDTLLPKLLSGEIEIPDELEVE